MNYSAEHMQEVVKIAQSIDISKIELMVMKLSELRKNSGRLFVLGVGGSAGNSSHAVNDFRKLAGIEAYAPTDNISEITARTNDEGWETVFDSYLKVSKLNEKDGILILSVGGGDLERKVSLNLCRAIDYAKEKGATVFGIVGRETGYTFMNTEYCLAIPNVNNDHITPHSESFQTVIWHLMVTHPTLKANATKW